MRAAILATASAIVVFGALLPVTAARAGTIDVGESREFTENPESLTFSVRVTAPAGLASATLVYKVLNPDGNVGGSGEASFTPGEETDVTFTLETKSNRRYIPVGSIFRYRWELVDQDGATAVTEDREYLFLDGQFNWQSATAGVVTVYWYGGNATRAQAMLQAANGTLDRVGALLESEVPYAVRILVWASPDDGDLARRARGSTFDSQVTTGGQRVAPDLLLVFVPDPDIVRHEVGHIVTHVAGDGPFTQLPSWVDEGVAVWAQSSVGLGYSSALDFAVRTDNVFSLRSMQAASGNVGDVNIFYGQSYSVVDYLITQYGQAQFAEFFRVSRAGSPIDRALEQVYGVDQNGLYNEWRIANGLDAVEIPSAGAVVPLPQTEATVPPLTIPTSVSQPVATPATSAGEAPTAAATTAAAAVTADDSSAAAAIAVALVAALVAAILGGGGVVLLRRSRL